MERTAPAPSTPEPPLPGRYRWAFFALAWLSFVLGLVGAVLPVMPTTPFMLVALWAFARSSPRFHRWLYHHRIFGAPLRRWDRERTIPRRVKAVAVGSMAVSTVYVAAVVRPPWYALAAMAAVVLGGAVFVLRIPSGRRAP